MSEADDDTVEIKGKFRPEMVRQAYELYLLARTDEQVADFFGVSRNTLYNWIKDRPEFREARKDGQIGADGKVAASVFERAQGFKITRRKWMNSKEGPVEVDEEEYIPADVRAQQFWLQNRQPEAWNKQAQANHEKEVKQEENLIELAKFMCFTLAKGSKEIGTTIEQVKEPVVIEQKKDEEPE